MKKSLVALAALSAVSAFADVDVSGGIKMYGVLDQAVMRQAWSSSAATPVVNSNTGLFAAAATSRLGFRGNRDLSDGLKGFFQVEIELAPDTFQDAGGVLPIKNRGTFVGLEKHDLGSISMGTHETPYYEAVAMDANGRVEYKPQVWRYTSPAPTQDRAGNSVKFTTASFSGFQGVFMKAYGEQGDLGGGSVDFTAYALKYKSENLKATYTLDTTTNQAGSYRFPGLAYTGLTADSNSQAVAKGTAIPYGATSFGNPLVRNTLAAAYDAGFATFNYIMANASVGGGAATSGSLTTNTVGVKVPMDKWTVNLSIGSGNYSTADTTSQYGKVADTTVGGFYAIDKSTSAYMLVSRQTNQYKTFSTGSTNTTAVGLQYKF